MSTSRSFADVLRGRASSTPDQIACRFLDGGANSSLTYRQLDAAARALAVELSRHASPGDRAMLLFPPGLDYVTAFFGCLYASVIAVPAYPPMNARQVPRLAAVLDDATPAVLLTDSSIVDFLRDMVGESAGAARWVATDLLPDALGDDWTPPSLTGSSTAFLQYTSGTTGTPKGVVVSHDNLLHNSQLIHDRFGHSPDSSGVIWLPPYHDMGLIGGILQPVFGGFPVSLMSPLTFLRDPRVWLDAITAYGATTSGGPNFAFDLCVRKIPPHRRTGLDLSPWRVAFVGSDTVRDATLRTFAKEFGPYGFDPDAFVPCYGLAEATLMATSGLHNEPPVVTYIDEQELTRGHVRLRDDAGARAIVSCGTGADDQQLAIVDAAAGARLPDRRVGEIWLRGPSVTAGYWGRPGPGPEANGVLDGESYLRTGDLGFLDDGHLYVTGRIKDVVIIRGRNYAPDDIELTVAAVDARLRPGCGAAFGIGSADGGQLVVAHEVTGATELTDEGAAGIARAIRAAVADAHGMAVHTIALMKPGTLPKTSSGKLQRGRCRDGLADGTLTPLFADHLPSAHLRAAGPGSDDVSARIAAVRAAAADVLGLAVDDVPADQPLTTLGLDSVKAVELVAALDADGVRVALERVLAGTTPDELAGLPQQQDEPAPVVATEPDALTGNERAMWFLHQLAPDSRAYHLCHAVDITGPVTADGVRGALDQVVARHPALRTRFGARSGEPYRSVGEPSASLHVVDARGWDEARIDAELQALQAEPFDLHEGPLWRMRLLVLGPNHAVLALAVHHIVADLWSLAVVARELVAGLAGDVLTPTRGLGMTGVATAERRYLASAQADRDAQAWLARLDGMPTATDIATDRPRQATMTYAGRDHRFALPTATARSVRRLARRLGVTTYSVLLASFAWLLYRYTGSEDIVIGAPTPGRTDPTTHDVVGMLVNTVPVRATVRSRDTFTTTVADVAEAVRSTLATQRFPFARLVERVQPHRDPSRSPLFQVAFALQQAPGRDDLAAFALGHGVLAHGPFTLKQRRVATESTPFDLTVQAVEQGDRLDFEVRFNSDLWDAATIESLAEHWCRLLAYTCTEPSIQAAHVPLLSPIERHRLVDELSPAPVALSSRRLDAGLDEAVERTPTATALVDERTRLTYAELGAIVAANARRLRRAGVGLESRVGLLINRSAGFVVAALSVLRAGGAYVPLDPEHPPARLATMTADSQLDLILTWGHTPVVGRLGGLPLVLDLATGHTDTAGQHEDPVPVQPDNAAYVMHTSGTTGRPKGVCCTHRGARNLLDDFAARAPIDPGEVCAWWTSPGFDVSVYEIFEAIDAGAQLVVVPDAVRLDPEAYADWLADRNIGVGYVPPFAVAAVTERAERAAAAGTPMRLRRLMVGVEPIPHATVVRLANAVPGLRILHAYGPTETTIISTVFAVDPSDPGHAITPLGRPIRNTPLYVLDDRLAAVPIGVRGELYIGGVGVARGYHGQPALTADRFRPDPHVHGGRIYRSGDLVRYGRDGLLRFLGRRDNQVKLRGVRIELGEIEAALRADERVRSAVAVIRDVGGHPAIVGYVTTGDDGPSESELLSQARATLPASMLPAAVVRLVEWPLTRNGKLDRAALPALSPTRNGYEEPVGSIETTIAAVWSELLGGGQIGRTDDFFGLGGHSLLAARSALELGRRLSLDVPVAALFTHPTVASLAQALATTEVVERPIVALPRAGRDAATLQAQIRDLPEYAIDGLSGEPATVGPDREGSR